jgi:anti-anti-sigma factor
VTFLASYAIGMIIATSRAMRSRGHQLVLLNPSPKAAEVLAAARLNLVIPIVATEQEALSLIAGA